MLLEKFEQGLTCLGPREGDFLPSQLSQGVGKLGKLSDEMLIKVAEA